MSRYAVCGLVARLYLPAGFSSCLSKALHYDMRCMKALVSRYVRINNSKQDKQSTKLSFRRFVCVLHAKEEKVQWLHSVLSSDICNCLCLAGQLVPFPIVLSFFLAPWDLPIHFNVHLGEANCKPVLVKWITICCARL